jgi:TonB-dependent receptor
VNLLISYISYTSKKIENVIVPANDVVDVNIDLAPSTSQDLQVVEVVTTLNKENNTALILQQKNNSSVSDGVSAETIRRTPDRTTSDVLRRISGVTIQDDKFVIVRGLNERYNASYLNDSPLPSTEADKKAFAFNLFPANMLDNIVVNKTATPDMPSEFAGGIVRVNTKSIPEKNFVSLAAGLGYNTITTGKTKTIYQGGKYDRFGFDDGSRDLPAEVPPLEEKASWIGNGEQARMATYFKNDWGYSTTKFSPNSSIQFATGYNFKKKEKDFLGVIFSLGYNSTQSFYTFRRTEYDGLTSTGATSVVVQREREYFNDVSQTQNSTGSLLNLALKLNENHSVSLKNLVTGSSDNRFISSTGSNNFTEEEQSINRVNSRFFSANRIVSSQLNSEHYFPKSKVKVNLNGGLSLVKSTIPNLRFTSYNKYQSFRPYDPSEGPNLKDTMYRAEVNTSTGPAYSGYRVFSSLNENIVSGKADLSRNFKFSSSFSAELKGGAFAQNRERQYNIRQFGLQPFEAGGIVRDDSLLYLPEDQIFAEQNMSVTPVGTGGFKLVEITKADDNYYAFSSLRAGYLMTELKILEKHRLIGGARYETYTQQILVNYGAFDSVFVNSTVNDLMPSLNAVISLSEKTALRLAYYKTLNRPEFRELAIANWYDPETRLSTAGNAALTRCYIQNYDIRLEVYPGRGQLFTASAFHKYFDRPIERYMYVGSESQIYYKNANFGTINGAEMEFRIIPGAAFGLDSSKFLNNLTLFSNLSVMRSEVNVKGVSEGVAETRPMQGQAPYLLNAGITYADNEKDYSVSAMLNRVGESIMVVGNDLVPNRWTRPRTVVDLQLTKSFFKKRLEIRFNLKDLLHQDWIIYYKGNERKKNNYDASIDYINFSRNYGSTYSFVLSYRF